MKTTSEMIEVMQAFERGEAVQYRLTLTTKPRVWQDLPGSPSESFNWQTFDYRIKPKEPKVVFVNEYVSGQHAAYSSHAEAEERAKSGALRVAVAYLEMT